jgi:HemY protein
VSPVTGRLDAFQWQTPLAALPSDKSEVVEADIPDRVAGEALPPRVEMLPAEPEPPEEAAAQDNAPPEATAESAPPEAAAPAPAPAAPPIFRARKEAEKGSVAAIPTVIPIVRAPDDPGVDDGSESDEFAERISPGTGQAGGWRGFLSRWGG